MEKVESYVAGEWTYGNGKAATLVNPTTEEPVAEASTEGIDFAKALNFARTEGGAALRAMTFAERGEVLLAMSRAIHAQRDALIDVGIKNAGNTRSDAKFDIDGATGTLAYYGNLGKELGAQKFLLDGDGIQLARGPRFFGQHVSVAKPGVAVHVNAFNFPAWGLAEKAACALLAGMPVVSKPATSTALLAYRIVKLLTEQNIAPRGALSFVGGAPGDLITHLGEQDVLAFTGSSDTAERLRLLPNVARRSVRTNIEADSLNAAILGLDAEPGSETFNLFLKDVVRDMTQKAGQKCTAIRRTFVPRALLDQVRDEIVARLADIQVGDPALEGVTIGPLATATQLRDIRAGIDRLAKDSTLVVGGTGAFKKTGGLEGKGYFVPATLFVASDASKEVHLHEVFGPCATLIPYDNVASLVTMVGLGGGGLVASVYSDDRAFTADVLFGIAPWHGRVVLGSEKIADQMVGPGTVLPSTIHGGPGRAGGGEELGGLRGLGFYSQRVAIQGSRPILEAILGKK
jgi:oxepin-CoA hydrolase/3-oxo-5,6-dehydrosuberyl-CoA semialdehyde dehydrogenase